MVDILEHRDKPLAYKHTDTSTVHASEKKQQQNKTLFFVNFFCSCSWYSQIRLDNGQMPREDVP